MGKHSGATLARKAAEVDELYDVGARRALELAAQEHVDEALGTLVELMRGEGVYAEGTDRNGTPLYYTVPPQVRRQAALDILDRGFGKPGAPEKESKRGAAGVVVNIKRLTVSRDEAVRIAGADPIERFLSAKEIDAVATRVEDGE